MTELVTKDELGHRLEEMYHLVDRLLTLIQTKDADRFHVDNVVNNAMLTQCGMGDAVKRWFVDKGFRGIEELDRPVAYG